MPEPRPEKVEFELGAEHKRMLEEARKQPGILEAEGLFKISRELNQRMPSLLMSPGDPEGRKPTIKARRISLIRK